MPLESDSLEDRGQARNACRAKTSPGTDGRLSIVGIGPGGDGQITISALNAIKSADFVVGYRPYLNLISPLLEGKEVLSTGMGKEVERAKAAVDLMSCGNVAFISSGDPNIYGMAGLGLEMASRYGCADRVDVVPGVTSFCAAACRAGISFRRKVAVISLSDLLTPWRDIQNRASLAASYGMSMAVYNPRSRRRNWQLLKVLQMYLEMQGNCRVLLARNVSRSDEHLFWTTVKDILESPGLQESIDMFTLAVIIGRDTNIGKAAKRSSLNIIGTGPGASCTLTKEAVDLLIRSDRILGSRRYLGYVKELARGEQIAQDGDFLKRISSRVLLAKESCTSGLMSGILVGGDPSIFGSAWRVLQLAEAEGCQVHVCPGVSAFSAAAASAGAPLVNDFVLLSGKRGISSTGDESMVSKLSGAGFAVVVYNQSTDDATFILDGVDSSRPCALMQDVGRSDEQRLVCNAHEMAHEAAGLRGKRFTMIMAGDGAFIDRGRIITRRGYDTRYSY